ncbi:hypothetical protein B296_00012046 [Ensete ventricosum]|uniref:Uncharacterized protein n=1 Tax=Ensete ventricosum TaxID=4639 RepID=A0A427A9I6_ENSVE|nr:hypothetical protein B296_00012046 [Ensete ventricosum]
MGGVHRVRRYGGAFTCKGRHHFIEQEEGVMYLELGGDGVLVHVDVVLVDGGHDELVALRLHPGGDERREVKPWVPVQHQLVVDDLVRRVLGDRVRRHPEPGAAARYDDDDDQVAHATRVEVEEQTWGGNCGRSGRRRWAGSTRPTPTRSSRAPWPCLSCVETGKEDMEISEREGGVGVCLPWHGRKGVVIVGGLAFDQFEGLQVKKQ